MVDYQEFIRLLRIRRYLIFFLCFVFALAERKNEIHINGKYHAAAGETAYVSIQY
jgi:hypothetical protein